MDGWCRGRSLWFGFVSFWVLILLTGCSGGPADVPGPLRIATNQWLGYEPLHLARMLDLLPAESVRLVDLPSTTDILHALRTGTIEAAGLTLDEFIGLRAEGLDMRVVMVFDVSLGADALMAHDGIDSLEALRGRRVGVEQSAVGLIVLDAALKVAGLSMRDVEPVSVSLDQHLDAFTEGRVDAVVTFEPVLSRVRDAGGHSLFDSSQIPGRIVDVLAVRADALASLERPLHTVVKAWFDTLRYIDGNRELALQRMVLRQRLPVSDIARSLERIRLADRDENRRLLLGEAPELQRSAERMATLMRERGLLAVEPALDDLIDARFLASR